MPTGFLLIDPSLPSCQRGDDMGRKAGMRWLLTEQLATGFLDCFFRFHGMRPRNDAKRVNDAKRQQSPEGTTLTHPDMECRVFIILPMARSDN
jgi:hypothetical protein